MLFMLRMFCESDFFIITSRNNRSEIAKQRMFMQLFCSPNTTTWSAEGNHLPSLDHICDKNTISNVYHDCE